MGSIFIIFILVGIIALYFFGLSIVKKYLKVRKNEV